MVGERNEEIDEVKVETNLYLICKLRCNHSHIALTNAIATCNTFTGNRSILHISNIECNLIATADKVVVGTVMLRLHMLAICKSQILLRQLICQLFFTIFFTS